MSKTWQRIESEIVSFSSSCHWAGCEDSRSIFGTCKIFSIIHVHWKSHSSLTWTHVFCWIRTDMCLPVGRLNRILIFATLIFSKITDTLTKESTYVLLWFDICNTNFQQICRYYLKWVHSCLASIPIKLTPREKKFFLAIFRDFVAVHLFWSGAVSRSRWTCWS